MGRQVASLTIKIHTLPCEKIRQYLFPAIGTCLLNFCNYCS
jgi:hypothetical protein